MNPVHVVTGRSEAAQLDSFQNATLQYGGGEYGGGEGDVAFSVAMYVDLPTSLPRTEADVAASLTALLGALAREAERIGVTVRFRAEVGPAGRDD